MVFSGSLLYDLVWFYWRSNGMSWYFGVHGFNWCLIRIIWWKMIQFGLLNWVQRVCLIWFNDLMGTNGMSYDLMMIWWDLRGVSCGV